MFSSRALTMVAFTVSLMAGLSAAAEPINCVKAYREANTRYFKEIGDYKNRKLNAGGGTLVGVGAGLVCLAARRPAGGALGVAGSAGCAVVGGILAAPAAAVWRIQAKKIQALEDARILYQLYFVSKTDTEVGSDDFERLLEDTGATERQIPDLKEAMIEMVDEGILCDEAGQAAASYDDVVDELKEKVLR